MSIFSDLVFFDFGSSTERSSDERFFESRGDIIPGKMPTLKSISLVVAASLNSTCNNCVGFFFVFVLI